MTYVRVKDRDTKHECTVSREQYETAADFYDLLDKEATAPDGTPLPPKHHESLSTKKTGPEADTKKENS